MSRRKHKKWLLSRANVLVCRSFKKAFTAKRAEGENLGSIVAKSSGLIVRSAPSIITNWSAERLFATRAGLNHSTLSVPRAPTADTVGGVSGGTGHIGSQLPINRRKQKKWLLSPCYFVGHLRKHSLRSRAVRTWCTSFADFLRSPRGTGVWA